MSERAAHRVRRLISLLPMLKQGETVKLSDLAIAVGCDVDDIVADLATLTMCGVPPFTPFDMIDLDIDGDTVTVYIEAPALDRPIKLTAREALALSAALDAAGYGRETPLRAKLLATATEGVSIDELGRTLRAGTAPGGLADVYATLAAAADEHDKVRITYFTGSTGRVGERVVQPWALVNRNGIWYLVALCEGVGEERVFRLDRIRAVTRLGERFTPPTLVPLAVMPEPDGQPVADVRFAKGATLPDARGWPGAVIEPRPDGTTMVRVPYQSASWVARRVVAMLGDAEVLAPAEVRAAVRGLAETILTHAR